MKYKIFLLIICIIFLSSCNVNYNIEIKKDKSSSETITINNIDNFYKKNEIDDVIKDYFPSLKNIEYNIDNNNLIIKRNSDKYYNLNRNYTIEKEFGILEIDLNKISFKPNYDKCIFLFSDGGEYINNDKIDINLTIPFKVKNSNADKVNDKIYTWTYNANDCNKELYVEFGNSNISNLILIFIGIVIIIICIIVLKKRKLKQN